MFGYDPYVPCTDLAGSLANILPCQSHDGREQLLLEYIDTSPSLSEMRGSPATVLNHIDEFSATKQFLMNIGDDKGQTVANLIAIEKPKVFVELGGYLGYSAIRFASEMKKYASAETKVQYWSLESNTEFASIATKFICFHVLIIVSFLVLVHSMSCFIEFWNP